MNTSIKRNLFVIITILLTVITALITTFVNKMFFDIHAIALADKKPLPPEQAVIFISNGVYRPEELFIDKGTEVTWVNLDTSPHQIGIGVHTGKDAEFPVLKENASFSLIFERQETFIYHDEAFPNKTAGTINVN